MMQLAVGLAIDLNAQVLGGGAPPTSDSLLLETGDHFLLESGDFLLLE